MYFNKVKKFQNIIITDSDCIDYQGIRIFCKHNIERYEINRV